MIGLVTYIKNVIVVLLFSLSHRNVFTDLNPVEFSTRLFLAKQVSGYLK